MLHEFEGEYYELIAMKEKLLQNPSIAKDQELSSYVEVKTGYVDSLIQEKRLSFDEFHYRRTAPLHKKLLHILRNYLLKGLRHG